MTPSKFHIHTPSNHHFSNAYQGHSSRSRRSSSSLVLASSYSWLSLLVVSTATLSTRSTSFKRTRREYRVRQQSQDGRSGIHAPSTGMVGMRAERPIQTIRLIRRTTSGRREVYLIRSLGKITGVTQISNAPANHSRSTNKFYYMSRFMFPFIIIALFFAVCSLFLGLFALCSRIGSYLSSLSCAVALFFQTIVACLMT